MAKRKIKPFKASRETISLFTNLIAKSYLNEFMDLAEYHTVTFKYAVKGKKLLLFKNARVLSREVH